MLNHVQNYSYNELKTAYLTALENTDPRTKNYFLVWSDPSYVIAITVAYILFVIFGKRIMKNRQAFHIPAWFLVLYNLSLVALSIYMFLQISTGSVQEGYDIPCAKLRHSTSPGEMKVVNGVWLFFVSKAIELLDTVWMILRKKFNQVTFLHCFHHSTMLIIWWTIASWIPSGLSCYSAALNSFVHIIMYAYYGLSLIPAMKKHLWWKKYITTIQLTQFLLNLYHTLQAIYHDCDYPKWSLYLLAVYMIILFVLFSNFFIHEYIQNRNLKKKDKAHSNGHVKSH